MSDPIKESRIDTGAQTAPHTADLTADSGTDPQDETILSSTGLRAPPNPRQPGTPIASSLPVVASTTSPLAGSTPPLSPEVQRESHDRLVARLIVDRGLATKQEVEAAMSKRGGGGFLGRKKTFDQLLIDLKVLTPNQLERVNSLVAKQRTGRTIPGFRLLGKLGKGTTATVYKARQINLDRLVAIKVLPPGSMRSAKLVEQFYAEGRAAAKLNHANIVQAFDVGQSGDFHYFVMEYVEGETVHEVLQRQRIVAAEDALNIVIAVAEALSHAHQKGFVHRDVKPKNIIIDPKGTPKLADLGLARAIADREAGLAEKGHALGTPYYISPEQVRGEVEIGPPADVYGLGATMYHMVTGVPPFTGIDAREVMNKHLHQKPRPACEQEAGFHHGISEVIDKMLAKDPKQRYQDCEALLLDLNAWKAVFTLQRGEVETGRWQSEGEK